MINKYQEQDQILARLTPSSTSAVQLYKPVGNQIKNINKIVLCNVHTVAVTVDIYVMTPDGTPTVADAIFYQVSIPANSTEILEGAGIPILGAHDDSLYCKISVASKINFVVLGTEMGQP